MSSVSYSSDLDALWVYEPQVSSSLYERVIRAARSNGTEPGPYSWLANSPGSSYLKDLYIANHTSGGIPPELTKEQPEMGYNDYDNNNDRRSDQQKIDAAVLEAIAKPRREAEIARRIAAVTALEPLKDAPVGTLITFTRKNSRGDKTLFTHAALKTADDRWFVTGDGYRSNGDCYGFDSLLQWMTTGDTLAENVQQAAEFVPVTAPDAS